MSATDTCGLLNPRAEYEFAAIDDFSREAVAEITAERSSGAASSFLERVLACPIGSRPC